MGKWDDELKRVGTRSAENKKAIDDRMKGYENAIDAAQSFIGAHSKSAPKLSKALAEMMDAEEECGLAAGELSVYEDDFEKAKKKDDKDEMKKIEGKMKPLIQKFDNGKKDLKTAIDAATKAIEEITKTVAPLQASLA